MLTKSVLSLRIIKEFFRLWFLLTFLPPRNWLFIPLQYWNFTSYVIYFRGWFLCILGFSLWFCMCSRFHLFYWTSWRFVSNVWHKPVFWNFTDQKSFWVFVSFYPVVYSMLKPRIGSLKQTVVYKRKMGGHQCEWWFLLMSIKKISTSYKVYSSDKYHLVTFSVITYPNDATFLGKNLLTVTRHAWTMWI